MDIERTMEFIVDRQAKSEARSAKMQQEFDRNFARSNRRLDRIEKEPGKTQQVLTQTNRVVGKLASASVPLRGDVRRHEQAIARHEKFIAKHELLMEEVEDKLDALIDIVDKSIRRNGKK